MRVFIWAAGLVLVAAGLTGAQARQSGLCRVICGDEPAPAPQPATARPAPMPVPIRPSAPRPPAHRIARRHTHHYAYRHEDHGYYSYREAETVASEIHGEWHAAANDAVIPGPPRAYRPAAAYPPSPACDCAQGVDIEQGGWTGGVGHAAWSGGFMDGYGVVHYGGGFPNGPAYNSYRQSFQSNPSMSGPFQPRRMGGPAPR